MVSESSCEANKIYRRYPRLQNKFLLFFIILFIFQHEHNLPDVRVLNKFYANLFGKTKTFAKPFSPDQIGPGYRFFDQKRVEITWHCPFKDGIRLDFTLKPRVSGLNSKFHWTKNPSSDQPLAPRITHTNWRFHSSQSKSKSMGFSGDTCTVL